MKTQILIKMMILSLMALSLGACGILLTGAPVDVGPDVMSTSVFATVQAYQTEVAKMTTPIATSLPPTATSTPTTMPPQPSPTTVATQTPLPVYTPTAVPIPCDRAGFVKDVSVADGTVFSPGESFTKVWRLKNTGSCTWNSSYALVFLSGQSMGAERVVYLSGNVMPGETVDLSVKMVAPAKPGDYQGYWRLRNAKGVIFGLGEQADLSFWTSIKVKETRYKTVYEFATDYCEAEWSSGSGPLLCGGTRSDEAGFVVYLDYADLENRPENEPTLWVHPNGDDQGWISGTYPWFKVKEGDRFRAWVGCMGGASGCKVDFSLDYLKENGKIRNLGTWRENFEGQVSVIDLDLSDLAGKNVRFILTMKVRKNPEAADGFWFVPRIVRPQ